MEITNELRKRNNNVKTTVGITENNFVLILARILHPKLKKPPSIGGCKLLMYFFERLRYFWHCMIKSDLLEVKICASDRKHPLDF